jgi:hypothetical protein
MIGDRARARVAEEIRTLGGRASAMLGGALVLSVLAVVLAVIAVIRGGK